MYKSGNKIVSKSVEKLLKYRKMFKDILTFFGLNYRVFSFSKWTYAHSGNN